MNYRVLGKTNLNVSEIGYGTWQIANDPNMWVGADKQESLNSLSAFVDAGGNFIDTAWIYGYDDTRPDEHPSEELIGQFHTANKNRDKLVIATKIAPKNFHWPAWKKDKIEDCFPKDHIIKQVDDSLKSLKTDYLDLVQFHVWNDNWSSLPEWQDTVNSLLASGKVRNWGISINDYQPTNCFKAIDTGLISSIQFIFNIFHQKPVEKLLPYAALNNVGLIARVPLDEGGLSGKINSNTEFSEGDFRSQYFTTEKLVELDKRISGLRSLLNEDVLSLPELALRFILSHKEVTCAIPGMRKLDHVKSNVSYSDKGMLSEELMKELKKHSWERNFYPLDAKDPDMADTNFLEV